MGFSVAAVGLITSWPRLTDISVVMIWGGGHYIHIHSGPAYSQAISLIGSANSVRAHVPYLPDAQSKIRPYDLKNLGNKSEGLRLVGLNIPVAGCSAKNLLHCHL